MMRTFDAYLRPAVQTFATMQTNVLGFGHV